MGLAIKMELVIMECQNDIAFAHSKFCATSSSTGKYNF